MQEGSMKKSGLIVLGMIAGIILTISLLWISSNHGVLAESGPTSDSVTATPTATALFTDAGAAVETLQPAGGEDESPQAGIGSQSQPSSFVLPTPIPGESLVYFVPTDNDATATVLYLYNTDSVDHTVALRGFNYDGAMVYAQNIVVPASSFRRLVSDSVAAAPPPQLGHPRPDHHQLHRFRLLCQPFAAQGRQSGRVHAVQPGHGHGQSSPRSGGDTPAVQHRPGVRIPANGTKKPVNTRTMGPLQDPFSL
jgi:hypothetical protein